MKYTVMVVDDDEICLLMHTQIIINAGFHKSPLAFNSATKAWTYLTQETETNIPVIMFLDINMPLMNGWALLDLIHQHDYLDDIHVVMVSSSVDMRDKEKAATYSKVIEFIEKPLTDAPLSRLKLKMPLLFESE